MMNYRLFNFLLITLAAILAVIIYFYLLPGFIRDGGYLVIALLFMSILMIGWVTDRLIVITVELSWSDPSANGKGVPGGRFWVNTAIDQAGSAEVRKRYHQILPLLEANLSGIATLATISTLVGLLGTTIGMIRSFQALATYGAPDAVQLSVGISEALINTAGGLMVAITGIVFHNLFQRRLERFDAAVRNYHGRESN
ncbi:MAG: MotA/TolQ/ExbB proton channel family protein [Bacteroidetes bacterium]|nr:MotA/TolQ/ExbB proton channel family protein [Bacteroidota bacterium]